ncbi:MAG: PDZ domain-containing protein [Chloroflexi bacterium]|nr:MAG: PDZ domain-containing protein [Chloroflexota bacterium]
MLQAYRLFVPTHKTLSRSAGEAADRLSPLGGGPLKGDAMAVATDAIQLARWEGYREGYAEVTTLRRTVLLSVLAGILGAVLSFGSLVFAQGRGTTTDIARIYAETSPAVAYIQVPSAGVTGSGVVFSSDGHVLTNYHVISEAQTDQDVHVRLPGPGQVPATIVGYDTATDLAVLQVDVPPGRLTVARFGDPKAVRVGDVAIAIGNPFNYTYSLTVGHISAVGRRMRSNDPYAPDIEGVLQTDAAINPGNSGGPLFNARGQVIGINTRIESPRQGFVGIGLAIPSDTALRVAREIIVQGFVRQPFLGIAGQPVNTTLVRDLNLPVEQGLLIREIYPGSPAELAGLHLGHGAVKTTYGEMRAGADIVLSVDGQPVRSQADLNQVVARHAIGDTVVLGVLRNGRQMAFEITLTQRPPANPLDRAD